jgi:hypothetical protein
MLFKLLHIFILRQHVPTHLVPPILGQHVLRHSIVRQRSRYTTTDGAAAVGLALFNFGLRLPVTRVASSDDAFVLVAEGFRSASGGQHPRGRGWQGTEAAAGLRAAQIAHRYY